LAGTGSPAIPGEKYVLGIMLIAAAGIFAIGIVVGIVAVVSHGIHREQKYFQQERRFRDEHGIWAGPDTPEYFLAEEAPDRVTSAVRRLNALYVRHPALSMARPAPFSRRPQPAAAHPVPSTPPGPPYRAAPSRRPVAGRPATAGRW
jgi:hypothetical protein